MQVEHIARIGLATRRTAQNQRHFAVGHSLLREVVVNDQCGQTSVAEIFADGSTCKRCVILHSSRVGSRCRHDNRVRHCTVFLQRRDEGRHGRGFLSDGHVDAIDGLSCLVETLLVDDGIDGNSGFTRLAVADDELALSASDGNHRVDGFQTGLQRLFHGLTIDDARRLAVERHFEGVRQVDVALSINGFAQRIDDATEHIVVYTNRCDAVCALHDHTFLDACRRAEQHAADVVFLKVHHDGHRAVLELQEFVGLGVSQSVDAGHAVADGQHGAYLVEFLLIGKAFELV